MDTASVRHSDCLHTKRAMFCVQICDKWRWWCIWSTFGWTL